MESRVQSQPHEAAEQGVVHVFAPSIIPASCGKKVPSVTKEVTRQTTSPIQCMSESGLFQIDKNE